MKKRFALVLALIVALSIALMACAPAAAPAPAANNEPAPAAAGKHYEFVWSSQYCSLPLFVNNDYYGMRAAEKDLNCTIRMSGPQEIDMPAFIAALEQEIAKKPDGIMVMGWESSLAPAIDKVYDAGIPVICVDADVPSSKRICFVGSDWYEQGQLQAKAVVPLLKDKAGKAVLIGIPGADNNVAALNGYTDVMAKECPGIEVVQEIYNSTSNAQKVAETIGNLIKADTTIVAVGGFDSTCGPGIAQAIKEAGKIGQIYGTCVDAELEHLQGVKEGALIAAVGQKRQFFTYYGAKMLYDIINSPIQFTKDDKGAGITPVPSIVSTGFISANKDNVDLLIETANEKVK